MGFEDKEIDKMHCKAIIHEYRRCHDAFETFAATGKEMYLTGHTKEQSYKAYNAYSSFILHLYEFIISLHARDFGVVEIKGNKKYEKHELLDILVQRSTVKIVENRIDAIKKGYAPSWENDISAYEAIYPVPKDFSMNFRRMRNKVAGHVTYERIRKINLTEFFNENHHYLYLLYRDLGDHWRSADDTFPDLENITDFLGTIARSLRRS